jgi:hypothetical protein
MGIPCRSARRRSIIIVRNFQAGLGEQQARSVLGGIDLH